MARITHPDTFKCDLCGDEMNENEVNRVVAPRIFFLPLLEGVAPATSDAVAAFFTPASECGIKGRVTGGGRCVCSGVCLARKDSASGSRLDVN